MVSIELLAEAAFVGAVGGASYALARYARNVSRWRRLDGKRDPFDLSRFAATVTVGAGLGLLMALSGADPTIGGVQERVVAYAGATAVVDALIKAILDEARLRGWGAD